jgi:DmX-like protein
LLEDDPESPRRFDRRQSVNQSERQNLSHFGPRQGQILSRLLTHTHLPGLSSLDQMHLLALADTVSTCNTDFAERFAIDAAKKAMAKENLTGNPADSEQFSTDSLDDCGLRFLMAMKHFTYLLRCLPLAQRTQFQKQGVGTSNIVWAFHSESEEELLNLIPNYSKGQIKWSQLKELGFGWWCRNQTLLRNCVERLAKAAFQAKQDPLDAAIYYMAMKKKSVVWGLFRNKRDEKMTAFFQNNFSEDRWRKAALKNAFALLGKQRFDHAVAFFLLAGSLNDALEVCLTKLDDLQLALIITRLYEGEHDNTPPSFKRLIYEEILGCDKNGENQDWERAHPDPFLRSMALWILKDYSGSLSTLLQNDVGLLHKAYDDEDPTQYHGATKAANPNVFNFYVHLRTHPLLLRQHLTTAQEKKRTQVVLSGFSYGGAQDTTQNGKIKSSTMATDKQLHLEDSITPLERQLYFTTAHGHFKAGCPALALEVLSKLPTKVIENADNIEETESVSTERKDNNTNLIETGTFDWSQPAATTSTLDMGSSFDWGAPISKPADDEFKIVWDEEEKDDEEEDDDGLGMKIDEKKSQETQDNTKATTSDNNLVDKESGQLDIMAQQLKFIACLKILMEELSTLATGFEVDGGQLRYQLYVWLEREVEALKQLCSYSNDNVNISIGEDYTNESTHETPLMKDKFQHGERPTLHEILLQEKHDFEAKVHRAAKRKRWLKANETLLRTLLSYCSLHGASGGGLASVRMELVLLLQELQQEKTQQQLLSPLPFPTTLPLLSACVAGNKTVVADPIRYLQQHTHDMLQTVVELRSPPSGILNGHSAEIFILRDLAVALSACIYQSLCDSDTFSVKQLRTSECQSPGMETIARLNASCQSTHLMANAAASGRRRKYSTDEPVTVSTPPPKWPGVTNLRALLAREKDEDTPRLNVLLCEAFIASFMSLLVYGLTTCDCHILYRLVGQKFSDVSWASLFGGGVKKLLRKATSHVQAAQQIVQQQIQQQESADSEAAADTGMWTSITKHRNKLNMKLLGQFGGQQSSSNMKEDKPTYREQFVPPEMSMVSYFLTKPTPTPGEPTDDDYDSADSAVSDLDEDEDDEDVFADPLKDDPKKTKKSRKENVEHLNPNSMSWLILRTAIIKHAQSQLQSFITVAGLEVQELPVCSPLIHGTLRTLSVWLDLLKEELEHRGPASADFIPGCFVESENKGPAIAKYRSLLEKSNTPFNSYAASAAPTIRLWNYLVRLEHVQDVFIRAIFGKRKTFSFETTSTNIHGNSPSGSPSLVDFSHGSDVPKTNYFIGEKDHGQQFSEPVRIIHKDQESISAFCLNLTNSGMLALATPRELQEIDISLLLESPNWLEDECEFDIMNLSKDVDSIPSSGFLVIQASQQDK